MIRMSDFKVEGPEGAYENFNLKKLYDITGGEAEAYDAYFDPEGMEPIVRCWFEQAMVPAARTVAVIMRSFLKRWEKVNGNPDQPR